jgi:hypothetical protein
VIRLRPCITVSRRTVDWWQRYLTEPEVDGQLTTVMNAVVEDPGSQDSRSRQREQQLAAVFERPGLQQLRIRRRRKCRACFAGLTLEFRARGRHGFEGGPIGRCSIRRVQIELRATNDEACPSQDTSEVKAEFAK